ncbi:hypothetical protein [Achromobacter phage Motura]|uniref:Uncharacterized protein n=1 Tax=Achromobacter phage Motura TaxID=2591403 RepID=A0A514CST8_9CAUD|nr:hypothetical protein H1O15_gp258 [Achromobacter phage Motura]QDH83530.1 hypothetical protein [Achromobacter phage Motura]
MEAPVTAVILGLGLLGYAGWLHRTGDDRSAGGVMIAVLAGAASFLTGIVALGFYIHVWLGLGLTALFIVGYVYWAVRLFREL